MSARARVALLVQAEGANRAANEIDGVTRATKRIGHEADASGRKMKVAHGASRGFASGLRGVGNAAKFGAVAVAGLGVAIAKGAVDEYREAYKMGKQTNAVIKSTGGVANVSAKQVGDLANSISLKAGIDDEAIQSAENLLLTFTNVRNEAGKGNDIFSQTTKAAVDMSVALGTDAKSAAMQLGKALNDPIKGVTKLQRSGVTFTEQQKKQIETLQKSGKTMKAQGIILAEVNKEFGGSAAAQADPIDKAGVAWKNLEETLGMALAPTVSKLATGFATFVNGMQDGSGAGGRFAKTLREGFAAAWPVIKRLWSGFAAAMRAVWPAARRLISQIRDAIPSIIKFGKSLVASFRQAVGPIRPVLTAIKLVASVIMRIVRASLPGLKQAFKGAAMIIGGVIRTITALIHGDLGSAFKGIKTVARGVFNVIVGILRSRIAAMVALFGGLPGKMKDKVAGAFTGIWDGLKSGFVSAVNFIIGKWNGLNFHIGGTDLGPLGHLPDININTPDIPLLGAGANGLVAHATGPYLVGENGPEIATLHKGQEIIPNHEIRDRMAGDRGPRAGAVIELHSHTHLDGKLAAKTVRRVALADLLAKAPA
jgi:acid phosphatase family membrane protein YuiD